MSERRDTSALASAAVHTDTDHLLRLQHEARGFSFLPRQPVHSILSGRHSSRLRGRGLNFEELRAYLPGDDIRSIDWKATARARIPQVRVYTEERDREVWLVIDQRVSMFFGSRVKMKSVLAAELAALAAWRTLETGDRVGAIVFNDKQLEVITPQRNHQHVHRLLSRIVAFNCQLDARSSGPVNPAMFNQALRQLAPLAHHDSLVVLITDAFGFDDASRKYITGLNAHNDVIALFVYDEMERNLGERGQLTFSDGQQQLNINMTEDKLRQRFADSFDERLKSLEDASRRRSIPLLPIHTADAVARQLRELIGSHQASQRF